MRKRIHYPRAVITSFGPEKNDAIPSNDIPEEVWMKRLIESYRHQTECLNGLSAYAKRLEKELSSMQQKCNLLESDRDFTKGYLKHLTKYAFKDHKIQYENMDLRIKLAKSEKSAKRMSQELSHLDLYKSIIKSQYFHIFYLHDLLHRKKVEFNKDGAYTITKTDMIEKLIQECASYKDNNKDYKETL